jgi:hypothetical protein
MLKCLQPYKIHAIHVPQKTIICYDKLNYYKFVDFMVHRKIKARTSCRVWKKLQLLQC